MQTGLAMKTRPTTAMDRAVKAAICAAICRQEAARQFRTAETLLRTADRYTRLNALMCERALRDGG